MKRKVAKLRLSPNEEARIIREEHERRRKLRIQQVREQQRYISLHIRREVEQRRQRELEQLEQELREDWEQQQREKLHVLQRLYQESLRLVGQGHRSAKENEPDLEAIAQREEENHVKAEERYREALKELKSQRLKDDERQSQSINARRKALKTEKERSAKVASLPPPLPNPIQQSIDSKKQCAVKKSDVSAFAATHYHMPESTVDREADSKQLNAHEGAELEVRRLQDLQREEKSRREEQLEKARLRGKEALRREHLVQDRERLLVELEHMQQTDLLRRRQQVSQMPPQIFQPLLKRQEMREDFQREMEFAFEDMYTGERRVKGDLVVQLVPEPLPAPSTGSQDQELDVSLDEIATQGAVTMPRDAEREAGSTEEEASAQAESFKPAPRRALKKLLDRIRSQRNQWTDPAADSPTAITAQIPERDTTIDTGSLTSEENGPLPPTKLPEPAHSQPASETTEQSTAAGPPLPDGLASRVQEFEEERKRRERELDREKQQQVVLLQELEEQKTKLEQMLLEAQQEREDLKAVVTQDEPVSQPDVPVHDQEVTSVTPAVATELVPPAGEDDHTRRIKQYQQRLLEQNGIHQRSVEVARRRLEEYQRALQIRYNMTATSPAPLSFVHPHLHGTQSSHLPAPPQFLTTPAATAYIHAKPKTPAELPPRESDMSALPARLPGPSTSVGSQLSPPDEVGFFPSYPMNREPDVTAWLTDNIMQRVTEHLPERARPFSELLPHKRFPTHHLASVPTQLTSDPIQAISPPITDGATLVKRGPTPNGSLRPGSPSSREDDDDDDMESQRRELLEVQRRVLEQREAVALQQRRREEERQRREAEMEQMRRQKETLQTLIHTEEQLVPEAASEVLVSEDIGQTRLKLLVSLLRAIEESNGGTLSHLEDPQEKDGSPPQRPSDTGETDLISPSDVPAGLASAFPSGLFPPPPRAAKPPVTRIRLGAMEMTTEQHELSAIQEVETPVNASQVAGPLEDSATVSSHALGWAGQEDSESSMSSDRTLQTPSWSSGGQWTSERSAGSGTSSGRSGHLLWRERLLIGAETSPESSGSDSVLRMIAQLSPDSGRGADYSGPAVTSNRPYTESAHRTPDTDCPSSTSISISTGSYITTDPELNVDADKSPPLGHCAQPGRGADLLDVSSPSAQSSRIEDSMAADRPGLAVASLFNDSSIQHIIDRYTRELNISLNATGQTTDSEGSYVEEPGSSVSQQFSERSGEDESSPARRSLPSDAAGAQRSGLDWHNTVNPILEHFSDEDPSLAEEQDSFRPLIGQLTEQSSCLTADQRDSASEQLVGQPSAHSSMIGQLPGSPVSVSFDHGGWDSTLSRLIGQLSHQSSSHRLSGGQDFNAGQLTGQVASEQSTTWLDGGPGESRMRPLVVELDESAGQHSGSSAHMDLGVSTEASVPALPPEASPHRASAPGVNPEPQDQTVQNQTSPMDRGPERTEASVFPDSDSFHPLLAEVTHNETADPSMIFHLPEHNVPTSPEGQPASGENSVSASSEAFEAHAAPSVESELLRAEEPSGRAAASPASHDSSQLITSQCHPDESVLMLSPDGGPEMEPTALSLSRLTMCDDAPPVDMPQPEGEVADRNHVWPFLDKIMEAAGEKGILEQSEITLVSLTDTTLQDQETTDTEEAGMWDDEHPDGVGEEGQQAQETEGSESTSSQDGTPKDENHTHPDLVTLLEFQWGSSRGQQEVHQQKRSALLQRSSRRVEEIKAKGALAKVQPEIRAPSEAREKSKAKESKPVPCKTKTKSETQHKADTKSKGTHAEPHRTTESDSIKQKKPQLPHPVVEVKSCTPEQRKRDVSEMHQRTKRLYGQLEEVKRQKAVRNRQQAYATNRVKAKEFHKKTLQKLRAKQTLNVS